MAIKPLDKEGAPDHKVKELEEMTSMLEYGQRDYDPQLGRFHKVDRFAEKYYSVSSYHYGMNNPIMNIDVNGDYVRVFSGDGNASYIYQNGKLYHYTENQETGEITMGKEFSAYQDGQFEDSFLKATVKGLNQTASTSEGNEVINKLSSSSAITNIRQTDGRSHFDASKNNIFIKTGVEKIDGSLFNTTYKLAHEIFHSYQFNILGAETYQALTRTNSKNNRVDFAEVQAVGFENYIRYKLNEDSYRTPRKDYMSKERAWYETNGRAPSPIYEYRDEHWYGNNYWTGEDFEKRKLVWKKIHVKVLQQYKDKK